MKKPSPPPKPVQYCKDCSRITNRINRSFATVEFILGDCPIKGVAVLLSQGACESIVIQNKAVSL